MAGQWSRFLTGAALTLCVSGHALAQDGKVTVFAAASLTNAMQDIAQAYKKSTALKWSLPLLLPPRWRGRLKPAPPPICLFLRTRNGWTMP